MTKTLPPTRAVGYDLLRVTACVMVLILHASAQMWYAVPVNEPDWVALHVWNTLTRASVPIFFLLSGALLLNAPPPGKSLWTKRIPRLVVAYVVWSLLYGIDNMNLSGVLEHPLGLIDQALVGKFHLWFMPTMIGVYLLLPALYAIAHDARALRPYLWVFGMFGIVGGTVAALEGLLPWAVSNAFSKVTPELCKCCGYFLLGYALTKVDLARIRRWRWALLALFAVTVALTAWVGVLQSRRVGVAVALLHDNFALPTALEAVCLFLLARTCRIDPASRTARVLAWLSGCTLGVYLLHPFVMDVLQRMGFASTTIPAWVGVPALTVVVGLICFAVTALLRLIPVVGKWVV